MQFVHSTVPICCMSHAQCMCIIYVDTVNKWPTAVECVCCNEIDHCQNVTDQSVSAGSIQCITEHKGFEAVCIK